MAKRILIIDDSELSRIVYKGALMREGYEVDEAANGEEGFKKAILDNPDLILLDLVMPRLGGMGFLDKLQSDYGAGHIPVVVISVIDRDDEKEAVLAAGAKAYFAKNTSGVADVVTETKRLIGEGRGFL